MKTLAIASSALVALSTVAAQKPIFVGTDMALLNYDATATPATFGDLGCRSGDATTAFYKATAADLYATNTTNVCGLALDDPCIMGETITTPIVAPCAKCYLITLRQPEVSDDRCKNGKCPAWERTIMTKTEAAKIAAVDASVTGHAGRRFDLSALGWKQLCPAACAASTANATVLPTCAGAADHCVAEATAKTGLPMSGSVPAVQMVAFKRVMCGTTTADGTDAEGTIGTFPAMASTSGAAVTTVSLAAVAGVAVASMVL